MRSNLSAPGGGGPCSQEHRIRSPGGDPDRGPTLRGNRPPLECPTDTGREVTPNEQRLVYTRVFEVAIVNASLSKDEFAVLAHLRDQFSIDDADHARIEADLRDMIRQKTEDENVVDRLLGTLKDSVSLVGSLFDSVRTKSA